MYVLELFFDKKDAEILKKHKSFQNFNVFHIICNTYVCSSPSQTLKFLEKYMFKSSLIHMYINFNFLYLPLHTAQLSVLYFWNSNIPIAWYTKANFDCIIKKAKTKQKIQTKFFEKISQNMNKSMIYIPTMTSLL